MELYTKIAFPKFDRKLDYRKRATFMGSCFSENIGSWLGDLKFDVSCNVTGISYNPISIANHISRCFIGSKNVTETDFKESRGQYIHTNFHSVFNNSVKQKACDGINLAISELETALVSSAFLFLTFGTAIAFEQKSTGSVINNCHHLPSGDFTKTMLSEKQMYAAISEAISLVQNKNPSIQIILTVSPIRHLRHGAVANSRSKAKLVTLCELLETNSENCTYLPVYEYVMDKLRDYRFYRQDDFIHLNDMGIGMIREKFSDVLISKDALPLMARVEKWNTMKAHKIQNIGSEEANAFLKKIMIEQFELSKLLPNRIGLDDV